MKCQCIKRDGFKCTNNVKSQSGGSGLCGIHSRIKQQAGGGKDFHVYTTGLGYYGKDPMVEALLENVLSTLTSFGYVPIFYHYDEAVVSKFYPTDKIFDRNITVDDIKRLETIPNHLLIDCAHITLYKPGPSWRYLVEERKTGMDVRMYGTSATTSGLKINSFYPGFLGNYTNLEFIRDFQYFTMVNSKLVTFITKGFEKKLLLGMLHRGTVQRLLNFAPTKDEPGYPYFEHDIGALSAVYSGKFATELFWSGPDPTMD